jgi:hypothetical protein
MRKEHLTLHTGVRARLFCPRQNSLRWNSPKIPRMGILSGIGHPSFSRPFTTAPDRPRSKGAGTGEPPSSYGGEETIHGLRSPVWEGHGAVLKWRISSPNGGPTPNSAYTRNRRLIQGLGQR